MLTELKRCNSIGNIDGVLFLVSIMAGKEKISRGEIRNRCALENNITVNCPGAVAFFEYLRLVETTSDTVKPSAELNALAVESNDAIISQLATKSINRLVEDGIFDAIILQRLDELVQEELYTARDADYKNRLLKYLNHLVLL